MSSREVEGIPAALPLVLFNRYSLDISSVADGSLGPDGVSNRDVGMLVAIRRSPGITPSELAELVGITRSFASRRLRRFQEIGLIVRAVEPHDHRRYGITATAAGIERVDAFERRLGEWFIETSPQALALLRSLGMTNTPPAATTNPGSALDIVVGMAIAGQAYVATAIRLMLPFGAAGETDRYVLSLVQFAGTARPLDLARELRLSASGMNSVLGRLEDAGLISRVAAFADTDRRAVGVRLTARGAQAASILNQHLQEHRDAIVDAIAATLSHVQAARKSSAV